MADALKNVLQQRRRVAGEVADMLDARPSCRILASMAGIGVRAAARVLLEIGDASSFTSSAHLAGCAGIALVTHRSGGSITVEHSTHTGNRRLKRGFFLAAFAAQSDRHLLRPKTRRR